jgi:DNA invertase Pin-like site-specific DNA recombinase
VRVALYARVSTESQQARGTIGSQLAVLRDRVGAEGDEVVAEFCDDGHSGARLDRPGLDALRDAAEAGLIEQVWCLSPDRLARVYAYQVIVLDELARHGVKVRFTDAPPLDDDPQARLLTQVQGVIAEYERAKIAERYRRGKLFRSRNGEVLAWRIPYGYRRRPRDAHGPARLEVFEPEAAIVRRIFDDYVHGGRSLREIIRRLGADQIPPPTCHERLWRPSTLSNLLRNEAYIGRVYANRTEAVPDPRPGKRSRQVPRPREDWIAIAVATIIDEQTFEAAHRAGRDNSQWSPRRTEPNPIPLALTDAPGVDRGREQSEPYATVAVGVDHRLRGQVGLGLSPGITVFPRWISRTRARPGSFGSSVISRPSSQEPITWASSPGWLKFIACAAPSITATVTCGGARRPTSRTRQGGGMSGSRVPITASVGTGVRTMRSSEGNRMSSPNS